MKLKTISVLSVEDSERIIKQGQNVKVSLNNGEILIGEFKTSDYINLKIERKEEEMEFSFDEVKNIEVID